MLKLLVKQDPDGIRSIYRLTETLYEVIHNI